MIRNGARDALKIWTRGGRGDQQHGHGVRTSSSKKGRVEKRQGNGVHGDLGICLELIYQPPQFCG